MEDLKKHADKFGGEGVIDAAATAYHFGYFSETDVIEVQKHLDKSRKKTPWEGKKRLTVETRVQRLLGIDRSQEEVQDAA